MENEERYRQIKAEILGEDSDDDESGSDDDEEAEEEEGEGEGDAGRREDVLSAVRLRWWIDEDEL